MELSFMFTITPQLKLDALFHGMRLKDKNGGADLVVRQFSVYLLCFIFTLSTNNC